MTTLKIEGTIPVKKNRQRIGAHGGIYKDPHVRAYEELVGWEIRLARIEMIDGPFEISAEFQILATKDLDGVLTTVLDALQAGGAIKNDRDLLRLRDVRKIGIRRGQEEFVVIAITPLRPIG